MCVGGVKTIPPNDRSIVCLIGALVMVVGESVLGENHSGIAAVIGIVGIGIIGTSGAMFVQLLVWQEAHSSPR